MYLNYDVFCLHPLPPPTLFAPATFCFLASVAIVVCCLLLVVFVVCEFFPLQFFLRNQQTATATANLSSRSCSLDPPALLSPRSG